MAMIEIQNLTVGYEDRIVFSNFSATFLPATINAITGLNGSGKTTLLAAIAGDIKAREGSISLSNRGIQSYSQKELSQLRAVAAQNHYYWLPYSVEEILQLGHEEVSPARFSLVVESLAIAPFVKQSVTSLSGGQLQRVEIARALLRETPILILDEPFASQDLESVAKIKEILREARDAGTTVIFVAHERFEDLSWCDQIINLNV